MWPNNFTISRAAQDHFALRSQERAGRGAGSRLLQPGDRPGRSPAGRRGETTVVDTDEHPRRGVTLAALAKLPPAFREGGTVTAGNSSGINDGAAALLVMSADKARALGLQPRLRYVASRRPASTRP